MKNPFVWSVCLVLGGSMMVLAQNDGGPAPSKTDEPAKNTATASREKPFVNSLGMKFVPVPGTEALFSIWDTRVQDFREYAKDAGYTQNGGVFELRKSNKGGGSLEWYLDKDESWEKPGFEQGGTHPVVGVNWDEAKAFCAWLTQKERSEGKIAQDQEYRLPTDHEWSEAAAGKKYPWGDLWPPSKEAGNYHPIINSRGDYEFTSPVGSYKANQYGLYDMGGNVWQWCEDWYRSDMNEREVLYRYPALKNDGGRHQFRIARGASWDCYTPEYMWTSFRYPDSAGNRNFNRGFRCVLATVVAVPDGSGETAWDYTARGDSKGAHGDWDAAIADYDRAIKLDPKYAPAYVNRGYAKGMKGDQAGCDADYDRAFELDSHAIAADPKNADLYYGRAYIEGARKDWDAAITDLNHALKLDPTIAGAYYSRGYAKAARSDWAGAIADYDRAINLDPKFALAYRDRAYAKKCRGDAQGADADYKRAAELDPHYADPAKPLAPPEPVAPPAP